jgi:hypothetical protein
MNSPLQSYTWQILLRLVSIYCSLACLSFSSLAREEQEGELITGKQFPDGFGVEPSSLSPDKRYGVLVPADFDRYDETKPQNKLVEVETGRTLALIDAETGKAGFMSHGGIQPSRWSADGSFLLWEVGGKWSPRALVLLKMEDGKSKMATQFAEDGAKGNLGAHPQVFTEELRCVHRNRCSSHRQRRCTTLAAVNHSCHVRHEPESDRAPAQCLCPFRDGGYHRF